MNQIAAPSIRFLFAFWSLQAAIDESVARGFGRAYLEFVKREFPAFKDEIESQNPFSIGKDLIRFTREYMKNMPDTEEVLQEMFAQWAKRGYAGLGAEKGKTWQGAISPKAIKTFVKNMSLNYKQRGMTEKLPADEIYAHGLWKKDQVAKKIKGPSGQPLKWTPDDESAFNRAKKILQDEDVDLNQIIPQKSLKQAIRQQFYEETHSRVTDEGTESGGGRIPTPEEVTTIGKRGVPSTQEALLPMSMESKVDYARFFKTIDSIIPKMRQTLKGDAKTLFNAIYDPVDVLSPEERLSHYKWIIENEKETIDDPKFYESYGKLFTEIARRGIDPDTIPAVDQSGNLGGFTGDINENMNSIPAIIIQLRRKGDSDSLRLAEKLQRRGDLSGIRKDLVEQIYSFMHKNLTDQEMEILKSHPSLPKDPEETKLKKKKETYKHWRDIELRKQRRQFEDEVPRSFSFPVSKKNRKTVESLLARMPEVNPETIRWESLDSKTGEGRVWFHLTGQVFDIDENRDKVVSALRSIDPDADSKILQGTPKEVLKHFEQTKDIDKAWEAYRSESEDLQERQVKRDKYARLLYVKERRGFTTAEAREMELLENELKKLHIDVEAIPPFEHDLGDPDLETYSRLLWIDLNKELTPSQEIVHDRLFDKLVSRYGQKSVLSIKPIRPKSGELEKIEDPDVDRMAKFKWLDEHGQLTPEQDSTMDDLWDELARSIGNKGVLSIEPVQPKSGEKVASFVRIASRICRSSFWPN